MVSNRPAVHPETNLIQVSCLAEAEREDTVPVLSLFFPSCCYFSGFPEDRNINLSVHYKDVIIFNGNPLGSKHAG